MASFDLENIAGMKEARAYLARFENLYAQKIEDDLEWDDDLDSEIDVPKIDDEMEGGDSIDRGVKPFRASPGQALDALIILRLGHAVETGRLASIMSLKGTMSIITAAETVDQRRLEMLLPKINLVHDLEEKPAFHFIPQHYGRSKNKKDVLEDVEASLLAGRPVICVISRIGEVPREFASLVNLSITLPPPDVRMMLALFHLLYPGEQIDLSVDNIAIARLTQFQLISIVAAVNANSAICQLHKSIFAAELHDGVTLGDVHGQPEAVAVFRQLLSDISDWRNSKVSWADVTKSFLLIGPPGTGKTMLAHAFAGSAQLPLIKTSYSDCQKAGHQGDMLRELNAAAERAILAAPSVFFLDEIDSFHSRGITQNGYIVGVVNGLLTLLDRLSATEGVVLIAATNDRNRVDSAVIRPGRFDRHLQISAPDREGIWSLINSALDGNLLASQVDCIADQLIGATGAELAALLRDARTRARAAREPLSHDHVQQAANQFEQVPDPTFYKRISAQVAGQLISGYALNLPPANLARISLRGGEILRADPIFLTEETLRRQILLQLSGRAAEELLIGNVSIGAHSNWASDLAQATRLALGAEVSFGFGGSLSWSPTDTPLPMLGAELRGRVEATLQAAFNEVRELLDSYRAALGQLSAVIHERRELDAASIATFLLGFASDVEAGRSLSGRKN